MKANKGRLSGVLFVLLSCGLADLSLATGPANQPAVSTQDEDSQMRPTDMASDPEMYLQLIGRMQEKHLYFASLAHLDAFDRRWPSNQRATLLRADALRETGYSDQAARLYEGLLKSPLAASAQHGLGLIASKNGDLNTALLALSQANQMDPTNAAMLNDLGYVQILLQRLAEAGFNLHKATELDPKNSLAGANLALFYLLDNKPARADGIMDWYRLTEKQRKDIIDKAAELNVRNAPNAP
ncbi:MAG: hypothetical protein WC474_11730 [Hydrogenophilaceae bacterium]